MSEVVFGKFQYTTWMMENTVKPGHVGNRHFGNNICFGFPAQFFDFLGNFRTPEISLFNSSALSGFRISEPSSSNPSHTNEATSQPSKLTSILDKSANDL